MNNDETIDVFKIEVDKKDLKYEDIFLLLFRAMNDSAQNLNVNKFFVGFNTYFSICYYLFGPDGTKGITADYLIELAVFVDDVWSKVDHFASTPHMCCEWLYEKFDHREYNKNIDMKDINELRKFINEKSLSDYKEEFADFIEDHLNW